MLLCYKYDFIFLSEYLVTPIFFSILDLLLEQRYFCTDKVSDLNDILEYNR